MHLTLQSKFKLVLLGYTIILFFYISKYENPINPHPSPTVGMAEQSILLIKHVTSKK